MMINHKHVKRPVSSKNRLNLYGHSRNAVHSLFFISFLFLFFVIWKSILRKQIITYVGMYRATCGHVLHHWGSNLHLVHSSSRMSRFCQRCKCRLGKCAIFGFFFFFMIPANVGGNICCINTCCSSNINNGNEERAFSTSHLWAAEAEHPVWVETE